MSHIMAIIITCQVIISVASFWMNGWVNFAGARQRLSNCNLKSAPQQASYFEADALLVALL